MLGCLQNSWHGSPLVLFFSIVSRSKGQGLNKGSYISIWLLASLGMKIQDPGQPRWYCDCSRSCMTEESRFDSRQRPDRLLGPFCLLIHLLLLEQFSSVVKRPERENEQWLHIVPRLSIRGALFSLPLCLNGVHGDNFPYLYVFRLESSITLLQV